MLKDIIPIAEWAAPRAGMVVIAGPCSAESEEQVLSTARALHKDQVSIFRAGIWKPRTSPDDFQGVGEQGLAWLRQVRTQTGLPVAVEVATPQHVEQALRYHVDVVWLGARTTTNPFSVQAIADALRGVDVPVLVKNPINPDIKLWIGALSRLHRAGLRKLGAIHRGFSVYAKTKYRYEPTWEIPIELRRRIPELPILCDPSHICGHTALLAAVSQKALDLTFDGLMVEVHIDPHTALSDRDQQIRPTELDTLLASLVAKRESSDNQEVQTHIAHLRDSIDEIDERIIALLSDRMQLAQAIGAYKRQNNLSIYQPHRWDAIIKSRIELAKKHNLPMEFIRRLYQSIHEEAIRQQETDVKAPRSQKQSKNK